MRIGVYDIDSKKEQTGNGSTEKFPNIAAAQIAGYHIMQGDQVFFRGNMSELTNYM